MSEQFLYRYPDQGRFQIAVCYPNSYFIGMSNLGFLNLFHHVSKFDGVQTARVFIESDGTLFSPEFENPRKRFLFPSSVVSLNQFDLILFSVSYEMDYINLVKMLFASSLHPLVEKRTMNTPLIVAGGIAPTANPVIPSVFVDFVLRGDVEETINILIELLFKFDFKKEEKLINLLEEKPGFFSLRSNQAKVKRKVTSSIDEPAHSVVISSNTVFANRFLIEIARGCSNRCRFCETRVAAFPLRTVLKGGVASTAQRARQVTNKVGLIAPVLTDNEQLILIVKKLNEIGFQVSFSSLRADYFSEDIARCIKANKQNTVTFAPETGTENLRFQIGKILTDQQIYDAVKLGCSYGLRNFRLYFMYGLPGEQWCDIEGIVSLVDHTLHAVKKAQAVLHLSINPFVPKKMTPMEEAKLYRKSYYIKVQAYLAEKLHLLPRLTLRFESLNHLFIHYILSVGGQEMAYKLYDSIIQHRLRQFERYIGLKVEEEVR